jgi:hypothetical protein
MNPANVKLKSFEYHRFMDEAGDTTFYGKGKIPIVGNEGVSNCFILGMLKIKEPLDNVRNQIIELQNQIASDPYFNVVPSVIKKVNSTGYFLHAKDDIPEERKLGFDLIKKIDCSFEAVVGRKIYSLYQNKHNGKEVEFYADLLSHLLKNKLNAYETLVLNISHLGQCTSHLNLSKGLNKAIDKSYSKNTLKNNDCKVVFNVQYPTNEPILNLADYFCWSIQRIFEKGETRYYDYIRDQISLVVDLYDTNAYFKNKNFYNKTNILTSANRLK